MEMTGVNTSFSRGQQFHKMLMHFEDVDFYYSRLRALRNVNLVINKGEILFITGPSGAGKTTLLKLIAGDLKPTKGKIRNNYDTKTVFIAQVFQDLKLMDDLTVKDNLLFAFDKQIHKNRKTFDIQLEEMLRILDISDTLDRKITKLNRGAKQKVAILRALLSQPDIFVADEPTSALDKESAQKIFNLLNFMNTRKKTTIIWATHNRDLVKQFPGKIVHLDKGKLVYTGNACFI
jgi:ABC-type multidrug transport system ATPase subunit